MEISKDKKEEMLSSIKKLVATDLGVLGLIPINNLLSNVRSTEEDIDNLKTYFKDKTLNIKYEVNPKKHSIFSENQTGSFSNSGKIIHNNNKYTLAHELGHAQQFKNKYDKFTKIYPEIPFNKNDDLNTQLDNLIKGLKRENEFLKTVFKYPNISKKIMPATSLTAAITPMLTSLFVKDKKIKDNIDKSTLGAAIVGAAPLLYNELDASYKGLRGIYNSTKTNKVLETLKGVGHLTPALLTYAGPLILAGTSYKLFKNKNLEKNAEMALGIPNRSMMASIPTVNSSQMWEYVLQEHNADKAGLHYDFRIGPKDGVGFSWVLKNGLPKNDEKVLAVRQPDHTIKYFEFEGKIKSGYGAGDVRIVDSGQVEVLNANNNKITFLIYRGSQPEKYTLIRTGDKDWLMLNHTFPKTLKKEVSIGKLKYKDMSKTYSPKPGDFPVPKIDGAFSVTYLRPNKTPVVFGYKQSKRTGSLIEYTPKLKNVLQSRGPADVGKTLLRTEVFAVDPHGNEIPNRILSGILNSNVQTSRELQKKLSTPLRLAAFDILKYKGRDVSKKTPEEKLQLIREVSKHYPLIEHPIDLAKKYNFKEGLVVWRNNTPIKVKNKPDYDVYVRNIFPAVTNKKQPQAGGIEYSLTPNGPIVGRVGTGWNQNELIDMLQNPQNYIGRVAKVWSQEQHPSGALRAPSFYTWHIDK